VRVNETEGTTDLSPGAFHARPSVWSVLRAILRVFGTAWVCLAAILRPARARRGDRVALLHERAALLGRAARKVMRLHGIEVEASGPVPKGPALLVANHLSYLDPVVLGALVDATPIAKADLASWPLIGLAARQLGVIFVERGKAQSRLSVIHQAEQVLKDGGIVLNFPEGTTTDGSTVLPYRKALFGIAQNLGVPVIPAALVFEPRELAWYGDETFVPHYLRLAAMRGVRATLKLGEPLPSRAYKTADELAHAARARTISLLFESGAELLAAE
jgi:1-acyl-sn-glycerol-3-phosphate acyltransferase